MSRHWLRFEVTLVILVATKGNLKPHLSDRDFCRDKLSCCHNKVVAKMGLAREYVATYFLFVTANSKLRPHKLCRYNIFVCHDIIQLEHRQIYVATSFSQSRQRIALIQN